MTNQNKNFYEIMDKHHDKLNMYSKALTKVHGGSNPEVFDVRHLFERIETELKESDQDELNLDVEFESLRQVTNNYTVPTGACEAFKGVYQMLSEADQAYYA